MSRLQKVETRKLQLAGTGERLIISDSYNCHNARYRCSPVPARKNILFAGDSVIKNGGVKGTFFAVWAPNAKYVSVIGDFNDWDNRTHPLSPRPDGSGIWEGFIPGALPGQKYKYYIHSRNNNYQVNKGDPLAFFWEIPPNTASIIWDLDYEWQDQEWMQKRKEKNNLHGPISIYELHPGSWRRDPQNPDRFLSYRELAHILPEYINDMGFTHVEFMPLVEHPFYGSWGYQGVGYFAPTSRYGTPQDLMYLIDVLHQHDIGVILDWVPSHFPSDEHGLAYFDGTHLYEHMDPRKGYHPDWNSYIFNYSRYEVISFLISSALFWLDKYHLDGLRVDAVASMLYLDYSRKPGEWIPNRYGGNENLEAIEFLKLLNRQIYQNFPDVHTFAEESTSWPLVSRPTYLGGLGFGFKWNMGWMNDTLDYFQKDPIFRKYHQDQLTFSIWYAFSENFVLPLSHDEVVHGKGSLLNKMPGDRWQQFANLRLLFGYMFAHPGKKLLFMGSEFGQIKEWDHEHSLDWHLLDYPDHQNLQRWVRDLNHFYCSHPALFSQDFEPEGFSWIDCHDTDNSVLSFLRRDKDKNTLAIVCNFTPVPRYDYTVGLPQPGLWHEVLNSDAHIYGGSNSGNFDPVQATEPGSHNLPYSVKLTLPPLAIIFLLNQ